MQKLDLTGVLKDAAGTSYNFSGTLDPFVVASPTPQPQPEPQPAPEPVVSGIPLVWDDARFSGNASSNPTKVASGAVLQNKSFAVHGEPAAVVMGSNSTLKNVRIGKAVREGVRVGSGGTFTIDGCYLEATGSGDDHADTIQAYSPGSKGSIIVRNSSIVAHNQSATAGLFVADNWTGNIDCQNVVFNGGPFGLRLHADKGGDINVLLKDVFFVGPFEYDPFYFLNYGGGKVVIKTWENVRDATINNGVLVPGKSIARP